VGLYDRDYLRDEYEQQRRGFSLRAPRSMTAALILVNVALYLLNSIFFTPDKNNPLDVGWLMQHLSVSNATVLRPWLWWQFLTYGFAHSSVMHIFFNMLSLWFLGRPVEEMYGQKEYLRFYLITLVVCSAFWAVCLMIFDPFAVFHVSKPLVTLLGASGAVSAVVMLFIFRNPQATLMLIPIPIPIKAWIVGVMMVLGNLSLSLQAPGDGPHIAWSVHLTGIAFAFLYFRQRWYFGNLLQLFTHKPKFLNRPKLKIHKPDVEESEPLDLTDEVDRILQKIHEHGEASLTKQERRLLEIASKKYQKRKKE
jgi:membrane associated rhomboid family serine protease